jgi:hypothetical protein
MSSRAKSAPAAKSNAKAQAVLAEKAPIKKSSKASKAKVAVDAAVESAVAAFVPTTSTSFSDPGFRRILKTGGVIRNTARTTRKILGHDDAPRAYSNHVILRPGDHPALAQLNYCKDSFDAMRCITDIFTPSLLLVTALTAGVSKRCTLQYPDDVQFAALKHGAPTVGLNVYSKVSHRRALTGAAASKVAAAAEKRAAAAAEAK